MKRIGSTLILTIACMASTNPASAGLVLAYTEDSSFGTGTDRQITFANGKNTVIVTFNPILSTSPSTGDNLDLISLGSFDVTQTAPSNATAPTTDFTLRIGQSSPTMGSGSDLGSLVGSFKQDSLSGKIIFASTSIAIGAVTYALQGLTADNAFQLPTSKSSTLWAKLLVNGPSSGPAALATPEPSTIALAASALPIGLVWWRRRRKAATA